MAQSIYLGVIGVGGVGKAFLGQLSYLQTRLAKQNPPVDLRLILVRRSNKQLFSPDYNPIPIDKALSTMDKEGTAPPSMDVSLKYLSQAPGPVILVDNTSDPSVAAQYPTALKQGISIATPNKKAFSSDFATWQSIFSSAAAPSGTGPATGGQVFHEATVGAGLPVLSSLRDLLETGDKVTKIEGVFSGTMSFLFNSFQPTDGSAGGSFSGEVKKAKDLGFTEPDPRDDLNGLDVARKLTILARLVGLEVESPTSFPVQSLIPEALESCSSGDEFMMKLPEFDGDMDKLKSAAAKEGKVVRFVGAIDATAGKVKVGVETFEKSHPIAALKGSDNIINFYTERYGANPLIVQGAGAGGEVTAMGVLADVLRIVRLVQK